MSSNGWRSPGLWPSSHVLLLADEPTGNLDTHNGDQVMHLLRELVSEGQTILMVTHNPAHAAMADRIVMLHDGEIVHDRLLGEEHSRSSRRRQRKFGALP